MRHVVRMKTKLFLVTFSFSLFTFDVCRYELLYAVRADIAGARVGGRRVSSQRRRCGFEKPKNQLHLTFLLSFVSLLVNEELLLVPG